MKTTSLEVAGMSCQHCVMAVSKAVGALAGVESVDVDLEKGLVSVKHEGDEPSLDLIKETIRDAGYDPKE